MESKEKEKELQMPQTAEMTEPQAPPKIAEPKAPKAPRKKREPKAPSQQANASEVKGTPETPKKPAKRRKKKEITIESLEMNVKGMHALVAIYAPKAMISDVNAKAEATAIKGVIDEYDLEFLSHWMPLVTLAGTLAVCEIPTAMAIRDEHAARKAQGNKLPDAPKSTPTQFVVPIRGDNND